MDKLRICINSQTPLVRFRAQYHELIEKYGSLPDPLPLEMLSEGEDYVFTPGGVPVMVYPLLKKMMGEGLASSPHWISLNPNAPERVVVDGIAIHSISLEPKELGSYGRSKERIWQETHDLDITSQDLRDFVDYAKYNWLCTEKMFEILKDVDIFYVHDFQQLQVGAMIGVAAPTVFRWHIPFNLDRVSKYLRNFIVRSIEGFDAIVVSCKRDLEGLIRAGYRGSAHQIYPYVDQRIWADPGERELEEFCSRYGINEDDRVVLVVARMDRMKGQDVAIKAAAKIKDPVKLILVGDGSFSGSKRGGLALPKGAVWRGELETLAKQLGVSEKIIFTGYLSQKDLRVPYKRSDVVVLPSNKEGFGLVTIEGWLYKKPVVVSKGAGSSELVNEGINGYTFKPGDHEELAEKLKLLLDNQEDAARMGERGFDTARRCYIDDGMKRVYEVLSETNKEFGK